MLTFSIEFADFECDVVPSIVQHGQSISQRLAEQALSVDGHDAISHLQGSRSEQNKIHSSKKES